MLKKFEKQVIKMMANEILSSDLIEKLLLLEENDYYETGNGYFLTIKDSDIPKERIVLDKPMIIAKNNKIETGFVIFIEDNELTLECHGWSENVPSGYREREISLTFNPSP